MSKKILIADDEKNILRIIQFNVKKNGYDVITAVNGEEAYNLIKEEKPDLAILDIMMPKMTGFEICSKLKKEDKIDIKIILLSAKGQKNDIERGKDCGVDIYLTKPFSPKILIDNIKRLIGE